MKKTTKFYLALMLVAAMISACGAPAPTEPPTTEAPAA
jgi:predicted small lipoprotein YifL